MENNFKLGIAVISAKRPHCLKLCLESLKKQKIEDLENVEICLFQDGRVNKVTNIEYIPQKQIDDCLNLFENTFPEHKFFVSDCNLWISLHVKKALDTMFDFINCDAVMILEDDFVLMDYYVGIIKELLIQTKNIPMIKIVSGSGSNSPNKDQQHLVESEIGLLGQTGACAMWGENWGFIKSIVNEYYEFMETVDMKKESRKYIDFVQHIYRKNNISRKMVISHDGCWQAFIHKHYGTTISTRTINTINIGEEGEHAGKELWKKLVLPLNQNIYNKDCRKFNINDTIAQSIMENCRKEIIVEDKKDPTFMINKQITTQKDTDIILKTCTEQKIKKLVEIGTFFGATAYQIGLAFPEAQIFSFDIIRREGIIDLLSNVHFFTIPSNKILEEYNNLVKNADIVFVDGDHSYRWAKSDFKLAEKIINKDGCIILHDTIGEPGVKKFFNELLSNQNYCIEKYETPCGISIIRKNTAKFSIHQSSTRVSSNL